MILFIEPVSRNIGMFVPAYPLPLMEIASFVKQNSPGIEMQVVSIPMDYGLPLNEEGRRKVYDELLNDISTLKPEAVGISCTAISQAEEVISMCEMLKEIQPGIFIFIGGYFPTLYYKEILERTASVDMIVIGEGEIPSLKIIESISGGKDPRKKDIENTMWKDNSGTHATRLRVRFDLSRKAPIDLTLLRHPKAYDVLPYSFSRGCPYNCNFCMEEYIRPVRKESPHEIIINDLNHLSDMCNLKDLVVCDALFKSFDLIPVLRSLGMKIHFETRCDVLDPSLIPELSDVCGTLVLGFESASYETLKRMNKIRDKKHYEKYLSNTATIFYEAVKYEIPIMIFMIAGYPGDTEEDLQASYSFIKDISKSSGKGGYIFKIGECHIYPKTKIHELALSLPDVAFDDNGVFEQNIVRKPSGNLNFDTILEYTGKIYGLSNITEKLQNAFSRMIPFFRLPAGSYTDEMIPDNCYKDRKRDVFEVDKESLNVFKQLLPQLILKHKEGMSRQRSSRIIKF